jgi:hypothetical protein
MFLIKKYKGRNGIFKWEIAELKNYCLFKKVLFIRFRSAGIYFYVDNLEKAVCLGSIILVDHCY